LQKPAKANIDKVFCKRKEKENMREEVGLEITG
jgi:hypothetical protein